MASNVTLYAVFWVPTGRTSPNEALIERFLEDIGGPYANLLSQYGVNNQVNYGGSWIDTNAYPTATAPNSTRTLIQDSDSSSSTPTMQKAVTDADTSNPNWNRPGLNTLYVVFLASGTELCSTGLGCTYSGDFCAYHSAFQATDTVTNTSATFVYAAMPFDGDRLSGCGIGSATPNTNSEGSAGPNHDTANDAEISTTSHEVFEALTDPEVNSHPAWTSGANPADPGFLRGEIGDMCAYVFHPDSLGDGGDVTLNGDRYFIQDEWSNATSSCELPSGAIISSSLNPGCTSNTLAANDDGSTGQVPLPFALNFFGSSYSALWINNNGNVTFDAPLSTYTPFNLLSTQHAIVAPYFSDVDTRGTTPVQSGLVTYGTTTFDGRTAFCVNWLRVGYYAAHTNKLDSFQLLLVDRSDLGTGDFDIVFNYDKLQWETGDFSGGSNGLGGASARAGFSNGSTNALEVSGSGVNGALLDYGPQSLIGSGEGSTQLGRYIFPIRSGSNAGGAAIHGTVTDTASHPNPVVGATVEVCTFIFTTSEFCEISVTNSSGNYSVTSLPGGIYIVTVSPPSGSALLESFQPAILLPNTSLQIDFALLGPTPPPNGTTITSSYTNPDGTPVLYWQTTNTLTTHGCPGGTAGFTVSAANSQTGAQGSVSGALTESPAGSGDYSGSIPVLYPLHGAGSVAITITCPNPAQNTSFSFAIYIDPSGSVVNTDNVPISGATVTLYRSDASTGPFLPVTAGSSIMSPANRRNPDTTSATGTFGWDVLQGFYQVRASKAGCTAPGDPSQAYVDSPVEQIPPPVADLVLKLQCGKTPTSTALSSSVNPSVHHQPVTFTATVSPNDGGGAVAFYVDGSATPISGCGAQPLHLMGGHYEATCGISTLKVGSHAITASYSGDRGYRTSTSGILSQRVKAFGAPASIVAIEGTPQSAIIGTAFYEPLGVLVTDAYNNRVAGATVTFTAPSSGASGNFYFGTNIQSETTESDGEARTPAFIANSTVGSYSVTAAVGALSAPFVLTNTPLVQDTALLMRPSLVPLNGQDTTAYLVTVANTGPIPTSGPLVFTDYLPAGLTYTGNYANKGSAAWICTFKDQVATCTTNESVPVGGFDSLVLFVNVTAPAGAVLTNVGILTPSDTTPGDNVAVTEVQPGQF